MHLPTGHVSARTLERFSGSGSRRLGLSSMDNEKTARSSFSFATPDWPKALDGMSGPLHTASKQALGITACYLQANADHLKELAESQNAEEAIKCQLDFARQSWLRSFSVAWKIFEGLGMRFPSGSA
jgi:hypothetical protein